MDTHLTFSTWASCLDSIAALDHIGLEANGPWSAMELQEEPARITEHGPYLIPTPERSGRGTTILTNGL